MTKAIIFDFFCVLCPDLHWDWMDRYPVLKAKYDFYDDLSLKTDLGIVSEDDFIAALSRDTAIPSEQIAKEMHEAAVINQLLIDLIKELKPIYKIGLLSDASFPFLNKLLTDHNLYHYFDAVGISSEIGHTKRDVDGFRYVLNKLQVSPTETLFIDDNPLNLEQPRKLGMQVLQYKGMEDLKNNLRPLI